MTTSTIRCPVCGGPAHDCGNGAVYCGSADVTMSTEQIQQALTARDIARRLIDGATLHEAMTAARAVEPTAQPDQASAVTFTNPAGSYRGDAPETAVRS